MTSRIAPRIVVLVPSMLSGSSVGAAGRLGAAVACTAARPAREACACAMRSASCLRSSALASLVACAIGLLALDDDCVPTACCCGAAASDCADLCAYQYAPIATPTRMIPTPAFMPRETPDAVTSCMIHNRP